MEFIAKLFTNLYPCPSLKKVSLDFSNLKMLKNKE